MLAGLICMEMVSHSQRFNLTLVIQMDWFRVQHFSFNPFLNRAH
jgi:hypothetical protein